VCDFDSARIFAELIVFINIDDMETNNQNELTDPGWPSVLRIPQSDEFEQSYAVARLAAALCEMKIAQSMMPLERENAHPRNFLAEAWELIEEARVEHVLRPMTELEYMIEQGGSKKALATVLERRSRESAIPLHKLCDPERNKGDSETINGIEWKVFRSERGFDRLFWAYWADIAEKWRRGDQEIGTMLESDTKGNKRRVNFYSEKHRRRMRFRARLKRGWKRRGEKLLNAWKQNGLPPADFSALAEFRRGRDDRAANLKRPKRRRAMKRRRRQRNGRDTRAER